MIGTHDGDLLESSVKDLMISSERVAHVQVTNNLRTCTISINKKWLYGDSCI